MRKEHKLITSKMTYAMSKIIYHHRTRGSGAEGMHILGIQRALIRLKFEIVDISIFRPLYGDNQYHKKKKLGEGILNAIASKLPNIFFKILEIFYNIRIWLAGRHAILRMSTIDSPPDFIYERYSYFSFAMSFLSKKYKIPLILEVNTTCLDYDVREIRLKWIATKIESYVFKRAYLISTVSKYLKNQILNHYHLPEKRIVVIPNAIDPDDFRESEHSGADSKLKEAISFTRGKFVIGFTGIFVAWHGLEFLIDIFSTLIKDVEYEHPLCLLLVGDGPMRRSIEKKIEAKSISGRIKITGVVEHRQIKHYLSLFDIAILPDSNPFGSPMKIFEYMAMRTPIVAPRYTPIEEVIRDRDNGVLFTPRNQEDCIGQIKRLIYQPEFRVRLGEKAREDVLRKHTWDKNVEKLLERIRLKYNDLP